MHSVASSRCAIDVDRARGADAPRVEATSVGHGPALGDLLSATCGGWAMLGQRLDVGSRSSDGVDRWVLFVRAMWFMASCGGGSLHRCLSSPEVS